jgi:hypothetical protein
MNDQWDLANSTYMNLLLTSATGTFRLFTTEESESILDHGRKSFPSMEYAAKTYREPFFIVFAFTPESYGMVTAAIE